MKKEVVYAKSDEKFVKTIVLYAASNNKLYYDKEAKKEAVKTSELLEMFQKGVMVVKDSIYYKPVTFKTNGLVAYDGTSAVTFTAV